ncbi:MAG: hypothetical protein ACREMC_10490 [Gemmatimonadales bacterium]
MPDGAIVFLSSITLVGAFMLLFPLVRALAERIRARTDSSVKEELQGLREDVLAEFRDTRREIAELGERVDFTERLLAKQREPGRLADGR